MYIKLTDEQLPFLNDVDALSDPQPAPITLNRDEAQAFIGKIEALNATDTKEAVYPGFHINVIRENTRALLTKRSTQKTAQKLDDRVARVDTRAHMQYAKALINKAASDGRYDHNGMNDANAEDAIKVLEKKGNAGAGNIKALKKALAEATPSIVQKNLEQYFQMMRRGDFFSYERNPFFALQRLINEGYAVGLDEEILEAYIAEIPSLKQKFEIANAGRWLMVARNLKSKKEKTPDVILEKDESAEDFRKVLDGLSERVTEDGYDNLSEENEPQAVAQLEEAEGHKAWISLLYAKASLIEYQQTSGHNLKNSYYQCLRAFARASDFDASSKDIQKLHQDLIEYDLGKIKPPAEQNEPERLKDIDVESIFDQANQLFEAARKCGLDGAYINNAQTRLTQALQAHCLPVAAQLVDIMKNHSEAMFNNGLMVTRITKKTREAREIGLDEHQILALESDFNTVPTATLIAYLKKVTEFIIAATNKGYDFGEGENSLEAFINEVEKVLTILNTKKLNEEEANDVNTLKAKIEQVKEDFIPDSGRYAVPQSILDRYTDK